MDTLNEVGHALPAAVGNSTEGTAEHAPPSSTTSTTAAAVEAAPTTSAHRPRAPDPHSLPSFTARSFTVHGIRTDVWVQLFADRTVLACSQQPQLTAAAAPAAAAGRIGNWLVCKKRTPDPWVSRTTTDTDVTHVLGATQRDDPLLQVYAQQITERIAQIRAAAAAMLDNTRSPDENATTTGTTTTTSSSVVDITTTTVLLGLSLDPKTSRDPAVFRTIVQLLGTVYQDAIMAAQG